jgi:K+-transporting ATPase A subunit
VIGTYLMRRTVQNEYVLENLFQDIKVSYINVIGIVYKYLLIKHEYLNEVMKENIVTIVFSFLK